MLYSNVEFVVFFLIVLVLYRLLKRHSEWKFGLLVLASIFFYAWSGVMNLLVFCLVVCVSWFFVWMAAQAKDARAKKRWVLTGCVILAGHLFFWKYAAWVLTLLQEQHPRFMQGASFSLPLPIGISFFTLQGIAYIVDYGRGAASYLTFRQVFLAKSFFPQLVAGPIVRMQQIVPQLKNLEHPTLNELSEGAMLFVVGLFKKLAIADRMAIIADPVFAHSINYSASAILLATLAYSVQIWGDFSGYTDMGRGAAKMLGIHLPENFLSPYLAKSPSEFWRRWHITLSQWIRDYIYVPMGGSLGRPLRVLLVVMVTMGISGLWHGAATTFVVWGLYHGALLVIERVAKNANLPLFGRRSSVISMFALTMLGWLIFRATSMHECVLMLSILSGNVAGGASNIEFAPVLAGALACFVLQLLSYRSLEPGSESLWSRRFFLLFGDGAIYRRQLVSAGLGLGFAILAIISLLLRVGAGAAPFIYFQF